MSPGMHPPQQAKAAELDNTRLYGEHLILRTDTDAASADRDSAKAGAEQYKREMLKEQKEASEALAEVEKLKKKLVRPVLKTLGPFMRYTHTKLYYGTAVLGCAQPITRSPTLSRRRQNGIEHRVPRAVLRGAGKRAAEGAAVRSDGCETRGRKCYLFHECVARRSTRRTRPRLLK